MRGSQAPIRGSFLSCGYCPVRPAAQMAGPLTTRPVSTLWNSCSFLLNSPSNARPALPWFSLCSPPAASVKLQDVSRSIVPGQTLARNFGHFLLESPTQSIVRLRQAGGDRGGTPGEVVSRREVARWTSIGRHRVRDTLTLYQAARVVYFRNLLPSWPRTGTDKNK